MGHTSTHAVVVARLVTKGVDHGIHLFIVQLRSLEDHKPLPGIAPYTTHPYHGEDILPVDKDTCSTIIRMPKEAIVSMPPSIIVGIGGVRLLEEGVCKNVPRTDF